MLKDSKCDWAKNFGIMCSLNYVRCMTETALLQKDDKLMNVFYVDKHPVKALNKCVINTLLK